MSLHWGSFLIGALTTPLLVLLAVVALRLVARLSGRRRSGRLSGAVRGLQPLDFTPRLLRRLRHADELDEVRAKAS